MNPMLDICLECKATNKEKVDASEVYTLLNTAGYSGLYAGGKRSKGNGFWLRNPAGVCIGYKSCLEIKTMLKGETQ